MPPAPFAFHTQRRKTVYPLPARLPAHGAICQLTFRLGKQSSIISGAYAILGTWCRPAFCPAERRLWASAEIRSRLCDHGCGIRVKTVEEFAGICGFDAHKSVKGRKRHILVDTLGLLLLVYDTPADLHDIRGARCLLARLAACTHASTSDPGRVGQPSGRSQRRGDLPGVTLIWKWWSARQATAASVFCPEGG